MIFQKCPNCKVDLEVYENDTIPGHRESEEYYCPECGEEAGKVRTSGIPTVRVVKK